MIRNIIKLATLFIFTFSIFIASSYVMFNLNEELAHASIELEVDDKTIPLLNNIITAFQAIFGILSIGIGLAIIISIIMGKGGDEYETFG